MRLGYVAIGLRKDGDDHILYACPGFDPRSAETAMRFPCGAFVPNFSLWFAVARVPGAYVPGPGHRKILRKLRRGALRIAQPPAAQGPWLRVHTLEEGARAKLCFATFLQEENAPLSPAFRAKVVVSELINNLLKHGEGGFVSFWRDQQDLWCISINRQGSIDIKEVLRTLVTPHIVEASSSLHKGFWLMIAISDELRVYSYTTGMVAAKLSRVFSS